MSFIELVIKLPEDEYQNILRTGKAGFCAVNAIEAGTILTKGHGELVDIRPLMRGLYEEMCVGELTYTTSEVYKMIEKEAPTIIEAESE